MVSISEPQPPRLGAKLLALLGTAGALGACGAYPEDGDKEPALAVVTVSFDAPLAGAVRGVRIRATQPASGPSITIERSSDGKTPLTVPLLQLRSAALLRVSVEAFDNPQIEGPPLIVRRASTHTVAERSLSLPLRLNDECIQAKSDRDLTCLGATCRAGVCTADYVHPTDLNNHGDDAMPEGQSRCGPVDAGEPLLTLGRATAPFEPLRAGDWVQPQQGYQGASHFFFALRLVGVHDRSAIANYFGKLLASDRISNAVMVAGPFMSDADGCHLFELPFVLPPGVVDSEPFRLGATVFDVSHNAGATSIELNLKAPLPPNRGESP